MPFDLANNLLLTVAAYGYDQLEASGPPRVRWGWLFNNMDHLGMQVARTLMSLDVLIDYPDLMQSVLERLYADLRL